MKPHNHRKLQLFPPEDAPFAASPPPPQPLQQLYPNPPFDSAMAITVLILLTALFFLGFFSIYIRRFAALTNEENPSHSGLPSRRPGANHRAGAAPLVPPAANPGRNYPSHSRKGVDPEVISSLPVYTYYHGEAKHRMIPAEECPICLGEFEDREAVKMIPYCGHVFHLACIDTWLRNHVTCPVCRGTQLFGQTNTDRVGAGPAGESTGGEGHDTCAAGGGVGLGGGVRRSSSCSSCVRVGTRVPMHRSPSW